ncbi:MAG TPA: hypothetical protein VHZ06_08865 [Marmoricola sp.]|nr:hypothetical protein [Marmoricola sp.]
MASRLVIHIGAMKSGTSFIQQVLRLNSRLLGERGVFFGSAPGHGQFGAAKELFVHGGDNQEPFDPDGPWLSLVGAIDRWPGTAVISAELLATQSPKKVAIIHDAFAGADIQVILTARNLTAGVPSTWTESMQNRGVADWSDFVRALRGRPASKAGASLAKSFNRQQNIPGIAARWRTVFGDENFTLITVPPPGADPSVLWERFCGVAGIDPVGIDLEVPGNPSLDAASAVVLRRLNARLAGTSLPKVQYERVVKDVLAKEGLARRTAKGPRVGFKAGWMQRRAEGDLERLRGLGLRVVGDLDELRPVPVKGIRPETVSVEDQLDAAIEGLEVLVLALVEARQSRAAGAR